jgi:uncharacterized protein (TIGR00288 family)
MGAPQPRIALLIDADNAPADKVDEILTELSTLGEISIRRIYGNWTKPHLSGWQSKLLDYALRPMQQFDYAKGKNATDMAMTVDAMELLYTEHPQAFGIVSSDADFTPLVMHLRGKGAQVYGFGAAQTPKAFVNACSRFLYLESLGGPEEVVSVEEVAATNLVASSVKAELVSSLKPIEIQAVPAVAAIKTEFPTQRLRQDTRLMNLLRSAVQALQDDDGWVMVSALRTQIGNKASFDPRNYGYASLKKLLIATEEFEFKHQDSSRIAVRRKRKGQIEIPKVALKTSSAPVVAVKTSAKQIAVQDSVKIACMPLQPGVHAVGAPVPTGSRRGVLKPLPTHIHPLRIVLQKLALQRICVADILLAVPELVSGAPYSYSEIGLRLRASGLLPTSHTLLSLVKRFPKSFEVNIQHPPHTLRYLK